MARKQNGLVMQNTIEPILSAPLDARQQVKLKADLTDPASYPYSYVGMVVGCREDANVYVLVAKDTTQPENWKRLVYEGQAADEIDLTEYAKLVDIPDVSEFVKSVDLAAVATSGAYSDLTGTPDPYDDTQVKTDIAKIQSDLANYYLKTETYSKDEVDNIVATINSLDIVKVPTLPTQNIRTDCIYLVKDSLVENNLYSEWIYVNNGDGTSSWEKFGSASIDASNLVTKDELVTELGSYSTTEEMNAAISDAIDGIGGLDNAEEITAAEVAALFSGGSGTDSNQGSDQNEP